MSVYLDEELDPAYSPPERFPWGAVLWMMAGVVLIFTLVFFWQTVLAGLALIGFVYFLWLIGDVFYSPCCTCGKYHAHTNF